MLSESTVKAFKTLHVPVNRQFVPQFGGPARVDIVRADSSYRGEAWNSDVFIRAIPEGIWFGQVSMLFYASYCSKAAARQAKRLGASRQLPTEGRMALALV